VPWPRHQRKTRELPRWSAGHAPIPGTQTCCRTMATQGSMDDSQSGPANQRLSSWWPIGSGAWSIGQRTPRLRVDSPQLRFRVQPVNPSAPFLFFMTEGSCIWSTRLCETTARGSTSGITNDPGAGGGHFSAAGPPVRQALDGRAWLNGPPVERLGPIASLQNSDMSGFGKDGLKTPLRSRFEWEPISRRIHQDTGKARRMARIRQEGGNGPEPTPPDGRKVLPHEHAALSRTPSPRAGNALLPNAAHRSQQQPGRQEEGPTLAAGVDNPVGDRRQIAPRGEIW
jgi:hypothetical protein